MERKWNENENEKQGNGVTNATHLELGIFLRIAIKRFFFFTKNK